VSAWADAELVARTRGGDASAFAELYRAHAPAVAVAIRDQVHDADGVADVVQEVFARALERLDTLREPDRFRPWVLAIARHAAVDERRHRNRVVTAIDEDGFPEVVARDPGPDDIAELRDLVQLVQGCVAGLSRRDATAVTLVSELDFTPAEVGAALGVSPGAAKVVVHRARRRLHDALELELRVRRRASACSELHSLHDNGDITRAARHLQTCAECAALSEVTAFAMPAGTVTPEEAVPRS
jgi:RNA polymerase sigma-70 factor (ECF subfamily)